MLRTMKQGDRVGAAALIDEMFPRMRKLVRHLVRNHSDIEDFMQEAALAVWRSLPGYRGDGFIEHWVDKVVTRAIFGERRRRRSERSTVAVDVSKVFLDGALSVVQDEYLNRRRAIRLLAKLPIEQRQVVMRHHILEMSVPEIASELAIPFETVRSRLRLARRRVRNVRVPNGDR